MKAGRPTSLPRMNGFDTYVGIMVMEYSGVGLSNHAPEMSGTVAERD
jgi:hypothetical protein